MQCRLSPTADVPLLPSHRAGQVRQKQARQKRKRQSLNQTARELEADVTPEKFDGAFRKIVPSKLPR
jgi:hypothetical protein